MNGQQMIHRGLLQKELRQLFPLAISVVLLTALFGILLAISNTFRLAESGQSALFLLIAPAAFSVGAGAMSVGQDKESRTLDWLKTLPVSARTLTCTKLTATLIYFAGLWGLVYVSGFVISWFDPSFMVSPPGLGHPLTSEWAWYRIGLSLYVLFCGFLTAWYFSTAMVSLIAIVPLAILPATVTWLFAYARHPGLSFNSSMYDASLVSAMIPIALLTVVAAWLSFRFAHRHLDPAESKDDPSLFQRWNPYAQVESAMCNDSMDTGKRVVSPINAMLWQSWLQNRVIYCCLITIAAVGAILYYRATFEQFPLRTGGSSGPIGVVLIWLATTWMGVSVFLGDSMRDRIRFFADRGVSPTGIWLTRMWMPLSFVFASALVYAMMLWRNADSIDNHLSLPMLFIGLLIAFGWSQWFSQFGGGPILNFIVAPPFALAIIIYLGYVTIGLYTPFWFLGVCVIVPFIMTWLMTGRWMDRKSGRSKFVPHLSVVAFIVLLPIVNVMWQVWSTPTMPRAMRAELKSAMAGAMASAKIKPDQNISFYFWPGQLAPRNMVTDQQTISIAEDVGKYLDANSVREYFRQWLSSRPVNIGSARLVTVDNTLMNELSGRLLLARLAMEQASELGQAGGNVDPVAEPNVSANESFQGYRDAFELLLEVTVSLRRSEFLASQEAADWGEIFLIRELQHPFASDRIGEPLRTSALRLVGDMGGRNAARKRAVMELWFRNEASSDNEPAIAALANFNLYYFNLYYNARGELFRSFTLRRRFDHFIYGLLTALDAGPQLSNEAKEKFLKDRMASLFLIVSGVHEFVPETFPSYVVDNPLEHRGGVIPNALPGGQWFAGWELVGRDLANQSDTSEVSR